MTTLPAIREPARVPAGQGKRADLPLGTADWFSFPPGVQPAFEPGDLYIGNYGKKWVGVRDDRHVLVCAGPRAWKGISILIWNLIMWQGSAIVLDPKGENAMVTARRRGLGSKYARRWGQKVHLLDPFGEVRTQYGDFSDLRATYNPLERIAADNPASVSLAGSLAESLVVSEGRGDAFFEPAGRTLIRDVILHVCTSDDYTPMARHLAKVRDILLAGDNELRELHEIAGMSGQAPTGLDLLFQSMRRNASFDGVVRNAGARYGDLLRTSPRTLAGIVEVAREATDFLDDPHMRKCVAASSFSVDTLKTDPKGVTVYLCLPQRAQTVQFRWLRLVLTSMMYRMEELRHQPKCGHPVLMMLDEFASLKRMPVIENAAAQIAGYGVKMMFVVQSLAQLKDIYKDNWETFVATCGIKLFFGNDDHFTRKYVSDLVGDTETSRWTEGTNSSRTDSKSESWGSSDTGSISVSRTSGSSSTFGAQGSSTMSSSRSVSYSDSHTRTHTRTESESRTYGSSRTEHAHKRPLVAPDEVGRLFGSREHPMLLALLSGMQPLALDRAPYFQMPHFRGFYDPHPDHAPPLTLEAVNAEIAAEKMEAEERKRHAAAEKARQQRAMIARQARIEEMARLAAEEAEERRKRERIETLRKDVMRRMRIMTVFMVGIPLVVMIDDLKRRIRRIRKGR